MQTLAQDLNLRITAASKKPPVKTYPVTKIRLGLYKSWVPSADEGWTRFILELHEFPYKNITDADLRAGNLSSSYDVIIMPDHWTEELVLNGYPKGTMPPKYVGGITAKGVRHLKLFAKQGGTLIFLNSMCNLAIDHLGLPARNILKKVKREEFVCEGSLLRMEFDPNHPVAYGMPKEGAAVFSDSCAFVRLPSFEDQKEPRSVAKYPDENPLLSGWIYGEKLIRQKTSVLEVPLGAGKVILFGIPVHFRAQSYGTFKLLFNAIFYGEME